MGRSVGGGEHVENRLDGILYFPFLRCSVFGNPPLVRDLTSVGRDCARRRTYFLCFAKESRQRKATPLSATRLDAEPTLGVSPVCGDNGRNPFPLRCHVTQTA